jgi:small GTP-binding protein
VEIIKRNKVKIVNKCILDNPNIKLNLNAQEFKPKSMGQPTNQQYNPYGNANYYPNQYSNMYNPYDGMGYTGYNMNQGANSYNPNMMVNPNYNPNMPYQYGNQESNQSIQIPGLGAKNEPPKSSGIVGMDPNKSKKKAQPEKDSVLTQKPQQQQTQTTQKPLQQLTTQAKKPATTQPKKEDTKKENVVTQSKKQPTSETNIAEVTKKIEEIKIETTQSEMVLETDSKEGTMIEIDLTRKPVTIVFIGHVDAGKSTIAGSILYRLGQIDERTIEKYQREAKANNRESWFIAYIMDVNEDERERGKTVEVGKAFFETPSKRFTVLDAPGHASFVPNMLQGACLADYAALVISAKTGEFEAGFEKDGRTREHALLAKSLGVSKLIVIINKMDEETVKWSKERYDNIKRDLSVYLKLCGYNLEKHVTWIPMSGLTGDNMISPVDKHKCSWYDGPTLLELLDSLELPPRNENESVRVPILDRYKDQGIHLIGKIESGCVKYGATYTLMPNKTNFEVGWLFDSEERGVPYARPGEMVRVRISIYIKKLD